MRPANLVFDVDLVRLDTAVAVDDSRRQAALMRTPPNDAAGAGGVSAGGGGTRAGTSDRSAGASESGSVWSAGRI
jgi:hypothetical protein